MADDHLFNFFSNWLHQDVDVVYGTPADAARDLVDHPKLDTPALAEELRAFLGAAKNDRQLLKAAEVLHCDYRPVSRGRLRRELEEALAVLDAAVLAEGPTDRPRARIVRYKDRYGESAYATMKGADGAASD